MPDPDPDPGGRRPRAGSAGRGLLAPRVLLVLLTAGPVVGALAALTGSPTLRAAACRLAAGALIAGPLLAIALLILAAGSRDGADGDHGDEQPTREAA